MPVKDYGVWRGLLTEWAPLIDDDHAKMFFWDDTSTFEAAVNVKGRSTDLRLVYWFLRDCSLPSSLIDALQALPRGFTPKPQDASLDFVRAPLFDFKSGILVNRVDGARNDILEYMDPILDNAVANQAEVFVFGSRYTDKKGLHDVHMNQGNTGNHSWLEDNGTYQDGGIVLRFPDGHWEGIFLAFAPQTYQTDDGGQPLGQTLAQLLSRERIVLIEAALINPIGPDDHPTRGDPETVYILNPSRTPINLDGWTLENEHGREQKLDGGNFPAHTKRRVRVPDMPLGNRGGVIVLKDATGNTVHEVAYTQGQAKQEGKLVYFLQR